MKIMVFIHGYLPGEGFGGPVTSISNFSDAFGSENDIRIVCCNHDLDSNKPYDTIHEGWNRVGNAQVKYLADEELNYKTFNEILYEEKPNIIYASGIYCIGFNAPMLKAAKKNAIPVLLAPRGDICDNALKIKSYKKKPFLRLLKWRRYFKGVYFHATMKEEADNLKKYLGIDESKIFLLPNLPVSPVHKEGYVKEQGCLKVLFISRIQNKKNLLEAIKAVNRMRSAVQFDIYGPLENPEYWEKCKEEMKKAPKNVKVEYKGALSPKDAKSIYLNYDCFLFPTFSENYGHVIAEALLHDCPIVISKGTTPWDDVVEYSAGFAIDLGDLEGFERALEEIAAMDNTNYMSLVESVRKYVGNKMNISELKTSYINMMKAIH